MTQQSHQRRSRKDRRYSRAYHHGYQVGSRHHWLYGFGTGAVCATLVLVGILTVLSPRLDRTTVTLTLPSPGAWETDGAHQPMGPSLKQALADGWL